MKIIFTNEGCELDWQQRIIGKFVKEAFIILSLVVAVSTFVVLMNNAVAINESKTQFQTGDK